MTSFAIEDVREAAESVIVELIDLIATQDIHHVNGLCEIKFSAFGEVGNLDEGVLDRLLVFSKKLTKLTVSHMRNTSEHNRKELVYMCEKIFNLRPPLTHIDFYAFFTSEESV